MKNLTRRGFWISLLGMFGISPIPEVQKITEAVPEIVPWGPVMMNGVYTFTVNTTVTTSGSLPGVGDAIWYVVP